MKIWRTRDGYLAEVGDDFAVVSTDGVVARWFGSRAYSDEDDLWHWQHLVVETRLYERTTVERGPVVTRSEDKLVIDGLVAVEDRHVVQLIERALAADRDSRTQEALAAACAGDARVAAIVGDVLVDELAPELGHASAALAARVRAYDDAVAARLLRTLVSVARVRPGSAVETAYARGCLAACFEPVPDEGERVPAGSSPEEPPTGLAAELALRAAELEQQAEDSESGDATRTASAYFRAAAAIRKAAALTARHGRIAAE